MKYCINYKRFFKYINEIDEITIKYNPEDHTLKNFLNKYKDKRINISIPDEKDFIENNRIEFFKQFYEENPEINFAFILPEIKSDNAETLYKIIKNCGSPLQYFFNTRIYHGAHCKYFY